VFGVFNRGLQLAAHLMHDVEPVASATGSAVGTLLGRVDAEFQSGTWQSFFGFMAREAGPDIQLVGNNLVDLMNTLPPLLRDLQPLAKGFLEASDGALKLAGTVVRLSDQERELAKKSTESSGWLGRLAKSAQQAFQQMYPGTKVTGILGKTLDHIGSSGSGPAAKGLNAVTTAAKPAFNAVSDLNSSLMQLNSLLSNQSSEISWKQAQIAATKAIDAGSKALDGNSSKHLANRALVVQSTQSLLGLIDNEKKSGVSVHTMAGQLQNQILFLQRAHDKSAFMRQELILLERALLDVKSENIAIHISGSGSWAVVGGGHRVLSGGHPPGTGPVAAQGLFINTGTPGVDDQLIRAQRGELVVPVPMVNSGEVDHLRGRIPGFSGGGVVGHYSDGLGGLTKWFRSENSATITAIADSVAAAFKAAKPAPGSGGGHVGWNPGGGTAQWGGDVLSALRQVGVPQSYELLVLYQMQSESGGNPNIVNKWDSNWAAGHPSVGLMQVIAGTFDAYAGPYRNTGPFSYGVSVNPMANIYAALNYGAHNGRGFGTGPGQIGSGHGYANGGMITEPIVGVGASGTRYSFGERGPEWVTPGRGGGAKIVIQNLNITLPFGSSREHGRQIVEHILNWEKAAGANWRS
jgi:SLT domain-containing protein